VSSSRTATPKTGWEARKKKVRRERRSGKTFFRELIQSGIGFRRTLKAQNSRTCWPRSR
jgi:hypothetical protein